MREQGKFVWAAAAAFGMCLLAAPAGAAEAEDDEREISPKDLPAAVLAVIEAAYPDAKIEEATVETEDGKTIYDVELVDGDKEVDLEIAADGTILEVDEKDDEDEDEAKVEDADDEDDGDADDDEDEDDADDDDDDEDEDEDDEPELL